MLKLTTIIILVSITGCTNFYNARETVHVRQILSVQLLTAEGDDEPNYVCAVRN